MIRKFKISDVNKVMSIWLDSNIDAHSTKPDQFCLEIIPCRICSAFDYLMYPYYPAYMANVISLLSILITLAL